MLKSLIKISFFLSFFFSHSSCSKLVFSTFKIRDFLKIRHASCKIVERFTSKLFFFLSSGNIPHVSMKKKSMVKGKVATKSKNALAASKKKKEELVADTMATSFMTTVSIGIKTLKSFLNSSSEVSRCFVEEDDYASLRRTTKERLLFHISKLSLHNSNKVNKPSSKPKNKIREKEKQKKRATSQLICIGCKLSKLEWPFCGLSGEPHELEAS